MRRLILEEDEFLDEPLIQDLSSTSLLTTLIKDTWNSLDLFNSVNMTLENNKCSDRVLSIINNIVENLYINIGQLEAALQEVNDDAEVIDTAKEETEQESDLGDVVVPRDDVQVEMN